MGQVKLSFLPPQYWQDFQELVLSGAKHEWPSAVCEAYGREGQSQDGIDVLVSLPDGGKIGIQAKKRRPYDAAGSLSLNGGISSSEVDEMVKEAEKFKPTLTELVVATTALADSALQDHVTRLNSRRVKARKFRVSLWFWDRFQGLLNWNSDLQEIYYGEVIARTLEYRPQQHYLMIVRCAFNRPAFTTRLEQEDSGDDMVQALAETRAAVVTGILTDRKGRRVGRAPLGLDGVTGVLHSSLEECIHLLDLARQEYREGVKNGTLRANRHGVHGFGYGCKLTERRIDSLRGQAIVKVNVALQSAGLSSLPNYLSDAQ